ncbi:MAG: hypothetical protein WC809_04145 [Sinimarinibacterium sp.]|jgi:hypothetical protein
MNAVDVERYMTGAADRAADGAAAAALAVRRRIEGAVDIGELPVWVIEACEHWERAALVYGAAMARRELAQLQMEADASPVRH